MPSDALHNIILLTICYSVRNNITKIAKLVTMQGRSQRGGGEGLGARAPLFSGGFFQ